MDKRADNWSFGVVLWEMLTGERLFTGETTSHVLAAVLTKEPDFERVPVQVRRLLRGCLQKDAKQRLQAIGDWRLLLEEKVVVAAPSRSRVGMVAASVAVVTSLALAALAFIHFRETPPERQLLRYILPAPEKARNAQQFAVSPDGHYLAMRAAGESGTQLWVRALDSLQAQPLAGT